MTLENVQIADFFFFQEKSIEHEQRKKERREKGIDNMSRICNAFFQGKFRGTEQRQRRQTMSMAYGVS